MCRCPSRKHLFFVYCFLSFSAGVMAQAGLQGRSLTLQSYYGSFITGAPKATYIRDSYTHFTELSVSRQTDGTAQWHLYNNFPQTGISLVFGNPGSKAFLGRSVSIYPFVNFALVRTPRFRTGLRIGTGLSYIQKPYDAGSNHKNTIIGSHFNNYIHESVENELRLSSRWNLLAGVAFAHISNGGVKLPNFGLNFVTATAGLRYAFAERAGKDTSDQRRDYKRDHWRINASIGLKQTPWAGSPRYAVSILSGEYLKRVSGGSGVGGGLDLFYDPSLTRDPSGFTKSTDRTQNIQLAAHVLYERNVGRLSIPVHIGVYFLHPSKRGAVYQNFGLRYAVSPNVAAFYHLKIHAGKADYTHGGIGYTF